MEPVRATQDPLPQGNRTTDPQWRQRDVVEGSFAVRVPFEPIEGKKLSAKAEKPRKHPEDDELVASGQPVGRAAAARLEKAQNANLGPFDVISFT